MIHTPPLVRSDFQALPLEPLTKPIDGPKPLRLPAHLPRCAARVELKLFRKALERKLSRVGVGNRAERRAYVRQLRLAPV